MEDELAEVAGSDSDSLVRNIARFYVGALANSRDSARLCHKGMLTREQAIAGELPADSSLVAKAARFFGYQERR